MDKEREGEEEEEGLTEGAQFPSSPVRTFAPRALASNGKSIAMATDDRVMRTIWEKRSERKQRTKVKNV